MLFFLHLCPTGPLRDQIDKFRDQSGSVADRNAALKYPVHCTLVRGFRMKRRREAICVGLLDAAFGTLESPLTVLARAIYRGRRRSAIGITIRAKGVADRVEKIAASLRQHDFSLVNVLHITLAADFRNTEESALLRLAQAIDLNAAGYWAVKLLAQEPNGVSRDVKEWPIKW